MTHFIALSGDPATVGEKLFDSAEGARIVHQDTERFVDLSRSTAAMLREISLKR